tara:strand:- start:1592 stop:2161 length:570 start_codon:yes stop_codon:yes gene_type:complete
MQDPSMAAMIGQNPQAKAIMAALQAHIAEHLAFKYRQDIEEKLGAPLPPPGEELPEQIEVDLSRLVAEAGTQVMQGNQKKAATQKAQQQAKDPVQQQKQAELQLRAQQVQQKAAKDQQDTQLKQAELQRKAKKDQIDALMEAQKIKLDQQELQLEEQKEGVRAAADRRKDSTQLDIELAKLMSQKDRGK